MRALALVVVLLVLASCGGGAEAMPADVNVAVEMRDYKVELSVPSVKAGLVKFGVRNAGGMEQSTPSSSSRPISRSTSCRSTAARRKRTAW